MTQYLTETGEGGGGRDTSVNALIETGKSTGERKLVGAASAAPTAGVPPRVNRIAAPVNLHGCGCTPSDGYGWIEPCRVVAIAIDPRRRGGFTRGPWSERANSSHVAAPAGPGLSAF